MAKLQSTTASAVLELALTIEPSMAAVINWYLHVPVRELGSLSARQLVEHGKAEALVAFLTSIHRGDRG
jgi:hypothetical protein